MNKAEEIIKKLIDSGKINGEEAIILIKAIQQCDITPKTIISNSESIKPAPPSCDTYQGIKIAPYSNPDTHISGGVYEYYK